jgi:uncharacterized protein
VTSDSGNLVDRELKRARHALQASRLLVDNHLFQDAVSRSYYAVYHAARAALLTIGQDADTHKAVRRLFGLYLVKTGKIERRFAKILVAEQEDRELGDYDIVTEIDEDRACARLTEAEEFIERLEKFIFDWRTSSV